MLLARLKNFSFFFFSEIPGTFLKKMMSESKSFRIFADSLQKGHNFEPS